MTPDEQEIFFTLIVGGGPGSGEFVYDAAGNLRSSNVGQATTDPVQGIAVPQGFATFNGHGAVINLLSTSKGAFFQYQDLGTSVQGSLILAVASTASTDPLLGTAYPAGLRGIDPAFGDSITTVGAIINLAQLLYTQAGQIVAVAGGGATSPYIQVSAPEQGVSGHLTMALQGTSPDGTHLGQLLVARVPTGFTVPAPVTSALIEFQSPTTGLGDVLLQLLTASGGAATDAMVGARVTGDTNNRLRINADGTIRWGSGSAVQDTNLYRALAGVLATDSSFRPATMAALATQSQSNFAAERVIGTYTIPAGDARNGSSYTFWGAGVAGDTLTPTLQVRVRVGGLTGAQIGNTTVITCRTAAGMAFSWSGRLAFTTAGAASVVDADCNVTEHFASGTGAIHGEASSGAAGPDTTAAVTVVVTAQWSVANASNTISTTSGTMERIQH